MHQSENNNISNDNCNLNNTSDDYSESEIIINEDCIPDEAEINRQLYLFHQELQAKAQLHQSDEHKSDQHEESSEPIIVLKEIEQLGSHCEIKEGDVIIDDTLQHHVQEESKAVSSQCKDKTNIGEQTCTDLPQQQTQCDKNMFALTSLAKSNVGISTLLATQIKNPEIDLSPSIIALIKKMEMYSAIPDDKLKEEIHSYIQSHVKSIVNDNNVYTLNNNNNIRSCESVHQGDKQSKKVFERLYENRKRFEIDIREHNAQCSSVSLPVNTQNRLEKLYNDSKRPKMVTTQHITNISIKSNDKSIMILFNKFVTQFNKCVNSLCTSSVDNKAEDITLTLNQLKILFNNDNLCFLNEYASGTHSKQEELLYKVYYLLRINDKVSLHNVFLFALSILNFQSCLTDKTKEKILIYPKSTADNNVAASPTPNSNSGGGNGNAVLSPCAYFSVCANNRINISKEQSQRIFKDFQAFNCNWKNSLAQQTKKKLNVIKTPPFKPETNTKYNSTKVKGNLFSRIDQFKSRQLSFDKQSSMIRERKEKEEMEKCTFEPVITHKYANNKTKSKYKDITVCPHKIKSIKTKDEIDYEKNKHEYTFKPNLTLSNPNNNITKLPRTSSALNNESYFANVSLSYEEQAYIERMKKGRSENQRIHQTKMLRSPLTSNKSSPNVPHQRRPLLIIDIEIHGKNKRILIFKNDNPALVSDKFIKENKIKDKNLISQIREIVFNEMKLLK